MLHQAGTGTSKVTHNYHFLIITAYDAKKIQAYYAYYGQNSEMAAKASVFSALQLYLDFINLFIYILRFVGNRKD